jgi:hypothetical protein
LINNRFSFDKFVELTLIYEKNITAMQRNGQRLRLYYKRE